MRFVAEGDYDTALRVYTRWPLEELLELAFRRARREALNDWRFRWILWGLVAPHQERPDDPPKKSRILEGDPDVG